MRWTFAKHFNVIRWRKFQAITLNVSIFFKLLCHHLLEERRWLLTDQNTLRSIRYIGLVFQRSLPVHHYTKGYKYFGKVEWPELVCTLTTLYENHNVRTFFPRINYYKLKLGCSKLILNRFIQQLLTLWKICFHNGTEKSVSTMEQKWWILIFQTTGCTWSFQFRWKFLKTKRNVLTFISLQMLRKEQFWNLLEISRKIIRLD